MQNQTLIFIPDISGFTEFVNNTEIEHSQHIISELLDIIIQNNKLNFSISEIEGDAILFFKRDSLPGVKEIISQAKEMFINFHLHLKNIEEHNVCQCGACKSASNLSLKFITHLGATKEVNVDRFSKLIGSDLILAHRLLKNKFEGKEYLLLTESFTNSHANIDNEIEEWIKIQSRIEEIDEFGNVPLKIIDFNPLLKNLPDVQIVDSNYELNRKPDIKININAPLRIVHENLTNHEAKYGFVDGIKKVEANSKINRVNSTHTCVFDNFEINFVTKSNRVSKDNIQYSEEAELKKGFRFITNYILKSIDDITELSIYLFIPNDLSNSNKNFLEKLIDRLKLFFIIHNTKKGIKRFKAYCENIEV